MIILGALCALSICADAPSTAPSPYANDFEQAALGKPPEALMLLNGAFAVVQDRANKCIELAPDPLDVGGFLFGPADASTGDVSARAWAASSGRRFPEFGIGSNGVGGYKLIVVPATGTVELRKGDEPRASAPFIWKAGGWTRLRLRVEPGSAAGKWTIRGKAWADGTPEPEVWTVSMDEPAPPTAGRASAWGMPYSGTPIRFDDLVVKPL